jgi:hypothetical protein
MDVPRLARRASLSLSRAGVRATDSKARFGRLASPRLRKVRRTDTKKGSKNKFQQIKK